MTTPEWLVHLQNELTVAPSNGPIIDTDHINDATVGAVIISTRFGEIIPLHSIGTGDIPLDPVMLATQMGYAQPSYGEPNSCARATAIEHIFETMDSLAAQYLVTKDARGHFFINDVQAVQLNSLIEQIETI